MMLMRRICYVDNCISPSLVAVAYSHCILEQDLFDSLAAAKEEELDMLDTAPLIQETSRLGCQLRVTKEWADKTIQIPSEYRNMCATCLSLSCIYVFLDTNTYSQTRTYTHTHTHTYMYTLCKYII